MLNNIKKVESGGDKKTFISSILSPKRTAIEI